MELLVYPVIFYIAKSTTLRRDRSAITVGDFT